VVGFTPKVGFLDISLVVSTLEETQDHIIKHSRIKSVPRTVHSFWLSIVTALRE